MTKTTRVTTLSLAGALFVVLLVGGGCDPTRGIRAVGSRAVQGVRNLGARLGSDEEKDLPTSPLDGQRVYYVVEVGGERRSRGYQVRQVTTYRGRPAVVIERRQVNEVVRDGVRFSQETRVKTITAIDGAALYSTETTLSDGERRTKTVSIEDGKAVFDTRGPGGRDQDTLDVPPGVMFGIEPTWILAKDPRPGRTYTATVLDRNAHTLVRETATVRDATEMALLGEVRDVWVVETRREESPPVTMSFTDTGDLVYLKADDLAVRVVPREEAERSLEPEEVAQVVSTVETDFALPAWDNYTALRYEALPAEVWRPHLKNSEYVRVHDRDGRIEVELTRNAPSLRPARLPLNPPPELRGYLEKADSLLPHRYEIERRARAVVGQETDALRAVALLAGWIHSAIRFTSRGELNPSPLRTLESREGDCSEHADLFASLARALGIPTRHCQGLLIRQEEAVYHAWVEVWLNGVWVPVDTTVNRVGLPAGYLLTARGTGDGMPRDTFAWTMRKKQLRLSFLSASKAHRGEDGTESVHTLYPGQKRSYVVVDGNWLANLYWGFSLEKPDDWKGKISLDAVELASPDKAGSLKCEALEHVFRATEPGLDRMLEALERTMNEYRQIDARVVPFGTRYVTDALMADFTCRENGMDLRCRQYLVPKRARSYRISLWAPVDRFPELMSRFHAILNTLEL